MYKLLLVDDEQAILEGLSRTLDWAALGFTRIEMARNYHEAVNLALDMRPELAIFDVRLGNCYGYDIIAKLNERGLSTKYIMISGYGEFEYARQAISCGAKAYLLKPVDRAELLRLVERVVVDELGGALPEQHDDGAARDPVLGMEYRALSKLVNKVLLIVQSDYGGNLSLKSVAAKFQMNSAYLGQMFLKETRLKFSEYLMVYRLMKASEMIRGSDEKIAYIASCVGYTNMNYFYTHFHEFYNVSPGDLRGEKEREGEDALAR